MSQIHVFSHLVHKNRLFHGQSSTFDGFVHRNGHFHGQLHLGTSLIHRTRHFCGQTHLNTSHHPQNSSAKRDEVDCGRGRSERSERSPPQCLPSARRGRLSKQALLMYTYIQHFHILSIKTAIFMDKAQLLMGLSIETTIFMDKPTWDPLSSTEQGTSVDKHT